MNQLVEDDWQRTGQINFNLPVTAFLYSNSYNSTEIFYLRLFQMFICMIY